MALSPSHTVAPGQDAFGYLSPDDLGQLRILARDKFVFARYPLPTVYRRLVEWKLARIIAVYDKPPYNGANFPYVDLKITEKGRRVYNAVQAWEVDDATRRQTSLFNPAAHKPASRMITPESILTRIIDAVPPGAPLDAWLGRRIGQVGRAVAAAYATPYKGSMTPTTRPEVTDTEIVTEQFTPERVVAFDVDQARAAATDTLSPERRAELIVKRDKAQDDLRYKRLNYGQQSDLRSLIRAINAELAGNEAAKDVVKWLKARAKKGLGSFDIDTVRAALPYLPGWSVAEAVAPFLAGMHYADTGKGWRWYYSNAWRRDEMAKYRLVPAGKDGKPIIPADAVPGAGVIYISEGPIFSDDETGMVRFRYPTGVGTVWRFTAPSGEQKDIGQHPDAGADGLYKWAYTQGLDKAAAAVVGEAEAAVPADAATENAWARNLCQICFRAHALTPSGKLVDHAHRRPGWGYNVNPCPGSKSLSYALACDLTDDYARTLLVQLYYWRADIARLDRGVEADGRGIIFTITVYTLDANGRRIKETDAALAAQYGPYVVEDRRVPPGDPLWLKVRDAETAKARAHVQQIAKSIPFYRAAVRLWRLPPPGETASETLSRIWHGISAVDRVGL